MMGVYGVWMPCFQNFQIVRLFTPPPLFLLSLEIFDRSLNEYFYFKGDESTPFKFLSNFTCNESINFSLNKSISNSIIRLKIIASTG